MINKNCNSPQDLNWMEFKAMAEREPSLEGNWIYRLEQNFLSDDQEESYPRIDIWQTETRLFKSFENVMKFLQVPARDTLYNSVLTQIACGQPDYEQGAGWLFDKDGKKIDYTLTHSYRLREIPEAFFYGRPEARQRFKPGEIVECLRRKEISLCVVAALPPSLEWCWKYKEKGNDYLLDYTDDSVMVLNGPSYRDHDHVSPLFLMKPRFHISDDIKNGMQTWLDRAEKEFG